MVRRKKVLLAGVIILLLTAAACETKSYEDSLEELGEKQEEGLVMESEDIAEGSLDSEETVVPAVPETEKEEVPNVIEEDLIVLQNPEMYTYENMVHDLETLPLLYGEVVSLDSLGQTMDGREIYHLVIGNKDAEVKILINGSIHAREYMTSQLVMKQTAVFLKNLAAGNTYADQTYEELLQNVAIHVVPMSQFGMDGILTEAVKERVREIAALDGSAAEGNYLTRWKANGNGVDINRNFDALWESYAGPSHPSCDHYKGESVGCEPESAALIQLTETEMFDRTISYHTQGSVIYWYFAQEGELYDETLDFANCISNITGYPTDANYEYLDPAGYKDWGICKLGIAGLTVEVGRETSPVPASQFADIWAKNQYVWEQTILNAKEWE